MKSYIQEVEFVDDSGDGEAGYFIYLKDGWSFDPMSNDSSTFVPTQDYKEFVKSATVYKV